MNPVMVLVFAVALAFTIVFGMNLEKQRDAAVADLAKAREQISELEKMKVPPPKGKRVFYLKVEDKEKAAWDSAISLCGAYMLLQLPQRFRWWPKCSLFRMSRVRMMGVADIIPVSGPGPGTTLR